MNINSSQQHLLTDIFLQAVQTVNGERCTEQYLQNHSLDGDIYLVAIGKAACSMASGARTVLGRQIRSSLVITKYGHCQPRLAGIRVLEAGHPVPDQQSLDAGNKLLSFVNEAPGHANFLFLI